jgi:hypothetical protein
MATASETIDRVQVSMEDTGGRFFTSDDYVRSYNDALDEIAEITEINEKFIYVKRRKKAVYHDLRGILPPDALRVTSVWNPTSSKWLDPITVRELDSTVGRFWEKRSDQTRWWFMRGLWFLGTYPTAATDSMPVRVHFSALLPHIKLDGGLTDGLSSSPSIPETYHTAIEYYMVYDLLSERKETEKALSFYQKFVALMEGAADLAENRMRRDRTPVMGARR